MDLDHILTIWLGLLSFAGVIYPLYVRGKEREKAMQIAHQTDLEMAKSQLETTLVQEMQDEVQIMRTNRQEDANTMRRLTDDFRKLEIQLIEFESGINILIGQLVTANLEPAWRPSTKSSGFQ